MIATTFQLIVLMLIFSIVEGLWPAARERKWWRRPLLVDICSWLVHPLSVSAGITLAIGLTDPFLTRLSVNDFGRTFLALRMRVSAWHLILQLSVALAVADFLWYWLHRAYHRFSLLWAFHLVHHSSKELDWLSTSRLHPIGQLFNHAAVTTVLLLMGIPVQAVIGANVVIGAAAVLTHANVRWTFGAFQHVLVSPLFHQWHHARSDNGENSHPVGNYGALFSIWDRIFGTRLTPASSSPVLFGVQDAPSTLSNLFLHPLRVCFRSFSTLWCKRGKKPTRSF